MVDLRVELSGLALDNPVIPASGTFGYGNEFKDFYDLDILGSFSFKGTTKEPRFGNLTPRVAECDAGMLNAVGLQNPGIDAVIREELPRMKGYFHKPVIANIGGFSIDEFRYCCERVDKEPQVGLIEVNVSCPNVHEGGVNFGLSLIHIFSTARKRTPNTRPHLTTWSESSLRPDKSACTPASRKTPFVFRWA